MKKGYLSNLPKTAKGLIEPQDARFYYLRDIVNNQPRGVVCLGLDNGVPVKGVALCSVEDCFDKNEGRKLAYVRMKKAQNNKVDSEPILSWKGQGVCTITSSTSKYKSEYDVDIDEYEEKLLVDLAK